MRWLIVRVLVTMLFIGILGVGATADNQAQIRRFYPIGNGLTLETHGDPLIEGALLHGQPRIVLIEVDP